MKELLGFVLVLFYFAASFTAIYFAIDYWNENYFYIAYLSDLGLQYVMLYSIPLMAFIAWATNDRFLGKLKCFAVLAFWLYSVLLVCQGIVVYS